MLVELRIRNLAVIEDLALAFEPGLNVVTGETGAGKTVLMRALGLVLGDRGGADLVRHGAPEAEIEALFSGPGVAAALGAASRDAGTATTDDGGGVDDGLDDGVADGELTIRRVVGGGRQRAYVNDRLATTARLGAIGEHLVHVYGQHEHHTLLKASTQREILDAAGELGALVAAMRARHRTLAEIDATLRLVREGAAVLAARRELLRFQAQELGRIALRPGEAAELEQEREILRHAERLRAAASEAEQALYAGEGAALETVARHADRLAALAGIDPALGEAARLLDEARPLLEEAAQRLGARVRKIAADPERLEHLEERLAAAQRLARKYGCAADDLAAHQAAVTRELDELERGGADPAGLERQLGAAAAAAWEAADALSAARRTAAATLGRHVTAALRELAFAAAELRVVLEPISADADTPAPCRRGAQALDAAGAERVVFLFAPNPGEPARPLARIASGGELSRLMLALKTAAGRAADAPTLLFDEVDAGIGGAVAEVVGRKLAALARGRQVVCITHLPQIAACADHHFVVRKRVARGRTRASAVRLTDAERVEELARISAA